MCVLTNQLNLKGGNDTLAAREVGILQTPASMESENVMLNLEDWPLCNSNKGSLFSLFFF